MSGQSPVPSNALALLDEAIRAMELERQSALPILARAKGVDAERLFKAIKLLDDKLLEARAKHAHLLAQLERAARAKELAQAVRAIRAELETGEADPARREHLKQQAAAILAEIEDSRSKPHGDE